MIRMTNWYIWVIWNIHILMNWDRLRSLFPTCQVRVVRFYVSSLVLLLLLSSPPPLVVLLLLSLSSLSSCSTATRDPQCSLSDLNHDHPRPVFPAGPQPRPSTPSVPCRTSTTTIHAQCSLPDLQPRPSTPSVPCRTSTASIPAQCSLPDLNHDHPRPVFPAGPQPRVSTPKDMPHRVPEDMPDRMLEDMPDRMPEGMPDRMPDRMSDRMPEDMPDKVPECLPDRMPADLPDNMPEDMLDRMPDGMPEDLPDNMPEDMPDRMPDGMPEDMPGRHLPEDMPGRMPEDMPDRMPENMSDRMPEDLPVTKCINVMVGITRSKVICFFAVELHEFTSHHRAVREFRQALQPLSGSRWEQPTVSFICKVSGLHISGPLGLAWDHDVGATFLLAEWATVRAARWSWMMVGN